MRRLGITGFTRVLQRNWYQKDMGESQHLSHCGKPEFMSGQGFLKLTSTKGRNTQLLHPVLASFFFKRYGLLALSEMSLSVLIWLCIHSLLHLSCKTIEHKISHFSKVSLKLEDSVKVTQLNWHMFYWMHLKTWQIPCIKQNLIYTGEHCLDYQDGHYKSTQTGLCLDRRQNLYIHS